MPNTNTLESGGAGLKRLIDSTIKEIQVYYNEDKLDYTPGTDADDAKERHDTVTKWCRWCDSEYPGAEWWADQAACGDEGLDIRLLTAGYPIAGYAILLFLEACYAVDKALCDTNTEALAELKEEWHMPQEMGAYKYLLSKERKLWWEKELRKMGDEANDLNTNRVSLALRIMTLRNCLARLKGVLQYGKGIWENIWVTMNEFQQPPHDLEAAIFDRVEILEASLEALDPTTDSKQGNVATDLLPSPSHRSEELGGIRRRIPRAASPSINGDYVGAVQTSTVNEENTTPASDVVSSIRNMGSSFLVATLLTPGHQYLQSRFVNAMSYFKRSIRRYKVNGLSKWLIHKETASVITLCFVVTSVFFMAWSAILAKSQSTTSNFLGNLSQSILSNLSIYLIIATTVHKRSEGLHYESWFWLCLCVSSVSSVLGLVLYSAIPAASIIFFWAASFAQVVIPVLLVNKTGSSESRNGDDVERHGD